MNEYLRVNPTSVNVKNTNMLVDNNLTVSGTTNLQTTVVNNTLTTSGDVTVGNDLSVDVSFLVKETCQTFPNFVATTVFGEQASFTPNGSIPTVDLAQIIITEPFTKGINLNVSFSGGLVWRNGYISPINRIQYTSEINFFTVFIYKNGVLWQSDAPVNNDQGLLYENTFRVVYVQETDIFKYFLGNVLIPFIPDIKTSDDTPDVYSIRVSFNYLTSLKNYNVSTEQEEPFTGSFTTFQPAIYANVSYSFNGTDASLIQQSAVNRVSIVSYTHTAYAITSYSLNNSINRLAMDTNTNKEFQCVNFYTDTVRTNTLISNNNTFTNATISKGTITTNLRCKTFIAGYLLNGGQTFSSMPIFCSLRGVEPNNNDDYWVVMPGFKFELYNSLFYLGELLETFINTSANDDPQLFAPSGINRTSSVKVFFRPTNSSPWTEIKYAGISDNIDGN
jgi:hypothetical protein